MADAGGIEDKVVFNIWINIKRAYTIFSSQRVRIRLETQANSNSMTRESCVPSFNIDPNIESNFTSASTQTMLNGFALNTAL